VSDNDKLILETLMTVKEDVGSIKSTVDSLHESDKQTQQRLSVLEEAHNKQKGASRVYTVIGTSVGSALGAFGGFFIGRH
jgi:hypothetical protein